MTVSLRVYAAQTPPGLPGFESDSMLQKGLICTQAVLFSDCRLLNLSMQKRCWQP